MKKVLFFLICIVSFYGYKVNAKTVSFNEFKSDYILNNKIVDVASSEYNSVVTLDYSDNCLVFNITSNVGNYTYRFVYKNGKLEYKYEEYENYFLFNEIVNDLVSRIGILHGYVENDISRVLQSDLSLYNYDEYGIEISLPIELSIKPKCIINLEKGFGGLTSSFGDDEVIETNTKEEKVEKASSKSNNNKNIIFSISGVVVLLLISGVCVYNLRK